MASRDADTARLIRGKAIVELAELRGMESQIYEDHFYIIERFIGTL